MRANEFETEASNINFIKFAFEKALRSLYIDYKKRQKLTTSKMRIAKQKRERNNLKAYQAVSQKDKVFNGRPVRQRP